jgi:cation diffusion facilitator family transporter
LVRNFLDSLRRAAYYRRTRFFREDIVRGNSRSLGYIEGWTSALLNTALFGVKYWAGKHFGSVSMVAEAWHTLSDTLTSIIVILGFFISSRPADKSHPFGHGRAEPIGAVIISVLLAVVGVEFFIESIQRLRHFQAAAFGVSAIIIFLVSALLMEGLGEFSFWAGRKINSTSLKVDGWHHRTDAVVSAVIVIGAIFGRTLWWIDGAMGIAISLLVVQAALDALRNAAASLLGEKPSHELESRLQGLVSEVTPTATNFHHLHIHTYGEHRELTFHLDLPPDMALHDAHLLASRLEEAIRKDIGAESTIHIEPSHSSSGR